MHRKQNGVHNIIYGRIVKDYDRVGNYRRITICVRKYKFREWKNFENVRIFKIGVKVIGEKTLIKGECREWVLGILKMFENWRM